jgi:hypothetical protein
MVPSSNRWNDPYDVYGQDEAQNDHQSLVLW